MCRYGAETDLERLSDDHFVKLMNCVPLVICIISGIIMLSLVGLWYIPLNIQIKPTVYSVDLEVWSKLAKRTRIKRIASKSVRDFDCDWQRVNKFSHCVTLTLVLLSQIISYSVTKVSVLVVMECKHTSVIYVYELIYFYSILQGQQSIVV